MFEEALAEFAGSKYAVVTDSCTSALFLSLRCLGAEGSEITIPARTYISVPSAIIHADARVRFVDESWQGAYYLKPFPIIDSALRLRNGMYEGGLHCISFHARKHLKVGRGGAVLTDDNVVAGWLKRARFDGRTGAIPFMRDSVQEIGWNAYLTPEQAARGLQLLEALPPDLPDLTPVYPDLSALPAFADAVIG